MYAWDKLKLADTFASPENFFNQCLAKEAGLKRMGINAIRSNPNIVGYGMTGCNDPLGYGEGFITAFREFKPGTADALFDGFYPVRWCTFAEPVNVYRGAKVHLEAVLANEDAAPPGRVSRSRRSLRARQPNGFSQVDHGDDSRREKRPRTRVCHSGVLRRSADRRPLGQVSAPGHFRAGRCGVRRRIGVLRDRSGRHAARRSRRGDLGQRPGTSSNGLRSMASRFIRTSRVGETPTLQAKGLPNFVRKRDVPGREAYGGSDSCLLCARRQRRRRGLARSRHANCRRIDGRIPHAWTSSRRATIRWAGCRLRERERWGWSASIPSPKSI